MKKCRTFEYITYNNIKSTQGRAVGSSSGS